VLVSRESRSLCRREPIGIDSACLFVQKVRGSTHSAAASMPALVYGADEDRLGEQPMSFADVARDDAALEECLDELSEFVNGMERYAPTLLAVAMRALCCFSAFGLPSPSPRAP